MPETRNMAWISVEDALPPMGTTVLAWMPERWAQPYEIVEYSQKSEDHRKFVRRDGQWWHSGKRITHWMSLPSSPIGERED